MQHTTAFVLRVHQWHQVLSALCDHYVDQLSSVADVVVCLNVPRRIPTPTEEREWSAFCTGHAPPLSLVVFDEATERERHPHYAGAWLHAHHGLVHTYRQLAEQGRVYERYWFAEYDLRFTGDMAELLKCHAGADADLLGTHVAAYGAENADWQWWVEKEAHFELPVEQRAKFFAALCRLSPRLLEALESAIDAGYYSMIETFVSTVCADRFGAASMANLDACYWREDTVRYRPIICTPTEYDARFRHAPANRDLLFHPVKPRPPAQRQFYQITQRGEPRRFVRVAK